MRSFRIAVQFGMCYTGTRHDAPDLSRRSEGVRKPASPSSPMRLSNQRYPAEVLELIVEPINALGRSGTIDPLVGGREGDLLVASGALHAQGDR